MKKFEWIDHPSDAGFRAYGENLAEVFENAALALTEILVDTSKIGRKEEIEIEIEAEDKKALLYDWLEHFLYLQGAENIVASKFEIEEITRREDYYKLRAKAWGERFEPDRHNPRTEVKAVTYHMMEIVEEEDRCSAQVIVDI
ncbi:hypothetical protein AKJ45_00395 [candidate division MSBL1 archaeon SCGC-AAA261F19]|uniref:Protein archease n=2 Tax=candidate division MSBL1 TaxID=215777 RepID=A0A133VBF7_9EURY|nr:hypothetical protein AKJ43_00390 [candidate division MSBL1 archaeon SCGC-AAA261D19]KXB03783.1 hypothetical protein AKJ45_00395 [candidate division MSBL1 archaeon SCGC-AAA261F19]